MMPAIAFFVAAAALASPDAMPSSQTYIGVKLRGGGRYDNVRMCVATPAGVNGGPTGDVSFFVERSIARRVAIHVDVPVMRPIVFGTASQMLQFEPSVAALFRARTRPKLHVVGGPVVGVSLHYGPDPDSEASGAGRTGDFFALGPLIGGYVGLDFVRPGKRFNVQLGLTPYVVPLWRLNGEGGIVGGGLLDLSFRFGVGRRAREAAASGTRTRPTQRTGLPAPV